VDETAGAASPRHCPWCSAPAPAGALTCGACGAALQQRESIADLVIPGVTDVDPALEAWDRAPRSLGVDSPSQAMAPGAVAGVAMGDPTGILGLGALGVVAAQEYLSAQTPGSGGHIDPEHVGDVSEAALLAKERLDTETAHDEASASRSFALDDPFRDVRERDQR
jgi:hypothetical protein